MTHRSRRCSNTLIAHTAARWLHKHCNGRCRINHKRPFVTWPVWRSVIRSYNYGGVLIYAELFHLPNVVLDYKEIAAYALRGAALLCRLHVLIEFAARMRAPHMIQPECFWVTAGNCYTVRNKSVVKNDIIRGDASLRRTFGNKYNVFIHRFTAVSESAFKRIWHIAVKRNPAHLL